MIRIHDLNQYYGESHILWDVDLHIPAGSCTCLMGRNGVGKTTLLKTIMGILPIASGSLQFEDTELTRRPAALRARLGIGYVPQGREIFSQLTVLRKTCASVCRRGGMRSGLSPSRCSTTFPCSSKCSAGGAETCPADSSKQLAIGRALGPEPEAADSG